MTTKIEDDAGSAKVALRLAKEDFKFSCAHLTVFGPDEGELLHGHNYTMSVEIAGDGLDDLGFLVDVAPVKRLIRRLCEELDEHVLMPLHCPYLDVEQVGGQVTVDFAARSYSFPIEDVKMLPLSNITVEELARYLWVELAGALRDTVVRDLVVHVAETSGQGAAWSAALGSSSNPA